MASVTEATATLGPLVRLWGIPTSQLPPTPPSPTTASSSSSSPETLAPLLISILQESLPFIDGAAPRSGQPPNPKVWKHKADKTSPDSSAPVEVWERVVGAGELETVVSRAGGAVPGFGESGGVMAPRLTNETWMARRSVHADAAEPGTASWAEFARCFRDEHAAAEDAFTPNVQAVHEALSWDCGAVGPVEEGGRSWGGWSLRVVEMRHKVGRPVLKDRTFPVLQMAADGGGEGEFVVVSIPVPDFASSQSSRLSREHGVQVGIYVSIERIRKLGDGRIEWLMATASDAKGVLPVWVQNMAMPGVVWKDVPLFLSWIAKERKKRDVAKDGVAGPPKTDVGSGAASGPAPALGAATSGAGVGGEGVAAKTGPDGVGTGEVPK